MAKFDPKQIPDYINKNALYYNEESSPTIFKKISSLNRRTSLELLKVIDFKRPLGIELENYSLRFSEDRDSIGDILYFNKQSKLDSIFLIQIGDFFESFGLDAICLIDVLGLSPMGVSPLQSVKAGFPVAKLDHIIPNLLDAGLSVVVVAQTGTDGTKKKRSIIADLSPEDRVLPEAVSMGLFGDQGSNSNKILFEQDLDVTKSKIIRNGGLYTLLITYNSKGFSYGLISFGKKEVVIMNHPYPLEVIKSQIKLRAFEIGTIYFCNNCPYYAVDNLKRYQSFIKKEDHATIHNLSQKHRTNNIINLPEIKSNNSRIESLFDKVCQIKGYNTEDGWTFIRDGNTSRRLNPLISKTAEEFGVIKSDFIPDLISFIMKDSSESEKDLMRELLLIPPSETIRIAIENTLNILMNEKEKSLPKLKSEYLSSKIIKSIREYKLGPFSIEILHNLCMNVFSILDYSEELLLLCHEIAALKYNKGNSAIPSNETIKFSLDLVEDTISFINSINFLDDSNYHRLLDSEINIASCLDEKKKCLDYKESLKDFIFNNFADNYFLPYLFSGIGNSNNYLMELRKTFGELDTALFKLTNSYVLIEESKSRLECSFIDRENIISFSKLKPKKTQPEPCLDNLLDSNFSECFTTKDKYNKEMEGKFSFFIVDNLIKKLLEIKFAACEETKDYYQKLAVKANQNIVILRLISEISLVYNSLMSHAKAAVFYNLNKAEIKNENSPLIVDSLRPYWLPSGVKNNIELNSLSILTGSNASGKSTMLRSLGSACLLAMCGLRVPSSRLIIGNGGFSNIYIRSGTSDDPISGLSSHALEMSELASITNNCDKDSLLLLDEIGRGCPSASGASIAAATLEFLIRKNVKGLFATHWDEIFTLNSDKINNAQLFRMKNPLDDISEQFKLTEGKSKDKMAIQVAKISGIPDEIISNSYNFEKIIRASLDKNEITMNSNLKHRSFEHNNEKNLLDELTFLFNKMPIILRTENESMPPSMSKGSFLYVLLTDTNRIYVGESDNIDGRIKKHRKSPEKRNSIFFVFKMDNKSEARESESRTIKHLSKLGFFLISENDGNHYNF